MFISLDWISDFVDISDVDPKVVADKLTMATAEVEGVSTITRYVDGVLVGEIVSAEPFETPDGKTRTLCKVNRPESALRARRSRAWRQENREVGSLRLRERRYFMQCRRTRHELLARDSLRMPRRHESRRAVFRLRPRVRRPY